jgi:hypothetical protein
MITENIQFAKSEPTQFLIDPSTPEGRSSGLNYASAVKCSNLYTVDRNHVLATIGSLTPSPCLAWMTV